VEAAAERSRTSRRSRSWCERDSWTTELRFYPDGTAPTAGGSADQDFVDKPLDPARLLERIGRVLVLAE
jgi:hypothetical protein